MRTRAWSLPTDAIVTRRGYDTLPRLGCETRRVWRVDRRAHADELARVPSARDARRPQRLAAASARRAGRALVGGVVADRDDADRVEVVRDLERRAHRRLLGPGGMPMKQDASPASVAVCRISRLAIAVSMSQNGFGQRCLVPVGPALVVLGVPAPGRRPCWSTAGSPPARASSRSATRRGGRCRRRWPPSSGVRPRGCRARGTPSPG